eukprot:CAMPEP_0114684478 /NCGR_PEP_ID=MMETSP0191-20121206/59155_1 /TAXON_ID=126664 /ORGANISM="Sorites sp." /LENGTH=479 /DNA_ID=CAMNT_0001967275 /DNA_START=18 /DNA_END=1457 /DNA_ORIENTATION=-
MQLNDAQREDFMKLYKKKSCLMTNSPIMLTFMQKVKGAPPEHGRYPVEDWIALVRDMNQTLRKWSSSLGPKNVFEYDNGQVMCNIRNIMELCRPPPSRSLKQTDVKVAAAAEPEPKVAEPKVIHQVEATQHVHASEAVPVASQAKSSSLSASLSALAERIWELTSDAFAQDYPELFQYFRNLDAMSFQSLFDRDELRDFWSGPVVKGGRMVQANRIVWYNRPLRADVSTLTIQMCTRTQMDVDQAKSLCMKFNSTGCCSNAWACDFLHLCLCCGSPEHGFSSCQIACKLYEDAQKFIGSFGLDPLDPSSKWAGRSVEKTLLKLVGSSDATPEVADPLLSWYLSETESTTEDASKSSTGLCAEIADLSQEHPEENFEESHGERLQDEDTAEMYFWLGSAGKSAIFTTSQPEHMTTDEVCNWLWDLEGDRHRRYIPKFREHLIDGRVLKLLTLSELKEDLEVKELRNRKVIYEEIQKLFQH